MADKKEVKYVPVVAGDLSEAMKDSGKMEAHKTKARGLDAGNWGRLLSTGNKLGWFQQNSEAEVEDIQADQKRYLSDYLLDPANGIAIPDEGISNTGATITLRHEKDNGKNKEGDIKWTSWRETKSLFGYLTTTAKIVKAGMSGEMLKVEDGKELHGARTDLDKKATAALKVPLTELELFSQYIDSAKEVFSTMNPAEMEDAVAILKGAIATMKGAGMKS